MKVNINGSERKLRGMIRTELQRRALREQLDPSGETATEPGKDPSNTELTKSFKQSADEMAASVPTALNAEYAELVKAITSLAAQNKSKFLKVKDYVFNLAADEIEAAQAEAQ